MQELPQKFFRGPVKTIEQALQAGTPTLGAIVRDHGDEVAKSMLTIMVSGLVSFLNVGKTMGASQVIETVALILESFPHFRMEDIELCFRKIKKGDFGKQYDRIDGQTIIQCLSDLDWDRQETAARINENQHKAHKREAMDKSSYGKEYVQFLKEVVSRHKNPVGDTTDLYQSNGAYKTHQEKQIDVMQRWMRQFDNLYGKYGIGGAIRMIEIDGKMMDMNKFLETKLKNREND